MGSEIQLRPKDALAEGTLEELGQLVNANGVSTSAHVTRVHRVAERALNLAVGQLDQVGIAILVTFPRAQFSETRYG